VEKSKVNVRLEEEVAKLRDVIVRLEGEIKTHHQQIISDLKTKGS